MLQKLPLLQKLKLPYFFFLGWGIFWILSFILLLSKPGISSDNQIVTFESLPSLAEGGSFDLPDNKKFNWKEGQRLENLLTLEDLELTNITLNDILNKSDNTNANYTLNQFGYFQKANFGNLLNNVKGLRDYRVKQIPFVQNFLKSKGYNLSKVQNALLKNLVKKYPELNKLTFKNFDLSKYNLSSIPGLADTPLKQFSYWQSLKVSEVPALVKYPLNSLGIGGGFALVDLVLGKSEHPTNRSISGGYNVGFNKNCSHNCAQIELTGNFLVDGKQWISGKYQEVDGGSGCLAGKEPTGRHPYGPNFKVVVWNTNEATDMVETALFFRFCSLCGCSPYLVGPVPFKSYHVGEEIFVGL
ncbi:hypothetical protein [Gloeothece verrucosa]|uniref:Uncharacterized protein n=1 Tax=Gloeothece verrucosa (strain PCC 7822) TaxID=497965 RepID=E0UND4_GLOV7|nr:hypothetical protein [Gloeothece verrucosa]ADN18464.1 conserved hypothetical protein [Gloeothece verrucosa PCC 7822]